MCTLRHSDRWRQTPEGPELRLLLNHRDTPVRREDQGGAGGHLSSSSTNTAPMGRRRSTHIIGTTQGHVDGRAEEVDGALDAWVDGSIDAGAESTRIGEKYLISVSSNRTVVRPTAARHRL